MVRYQSDVEDTKESRYEDASHSRLAEHEQVWYPGTDAMESPRYERYIHAASSGAAPGAAAGTGAAGQSTNTSGGASSYVYQSDYASLTGNSSTNHSSHNTTQTGVTEQPTTNGANSTGEKGEWYTMMNSGKYRKPRDFGEQEAAAYGKTKDDAEIQRFKDAGIYAGRY